MGKNCQVKNEYLNLKGKLLGKEACKSNIKRGGIFVNKKLSRLS